MTARQDRLLQAAYTDGERCARKGLGVTKRGTFDYAQQATLFYRWMIGKGLFDLVTEAREEWGRGWFDGLYAAPVAQLAREKGLVE